MCCPDCGGGTWPATGVLEDRVVYEWLAEDGAVIRREEHPDPTITVVFGDRGPDL
jgi:hypothetical protein